MEKADRDSLSHRQAVADPESAGRPRNQHAGSEIAHLRDLGSGLSRKCSTVAFWVLEAMSPVEIRQKAA